MTYNEAYSKIIDAYFRDEIRAMDSNFCFCGTLSPVGGRWNIYYEAKEHFYTHHEYKKMEFALIHTVNENKGNNDYDPKKHPYNEQYEAALFAGMSAALDVLKQIHIERGEVIDEVPVFTKRQLAKPEPDKSDKKVRV